MTKASNQQEHRIFIGSVIIRSLVHQCQRIVCALLCSLAAQQSRHGWRELTHICSSFRTAADIVSPLSEKAWHRLFRVPWIVFMPLHRALWISCGLERAVSERVKLHFYVTMRWLECVLIGHSLTYPTADRNFLRPCRHIGFGTPPRFSIEIATWWRRRFTRKQWWIFARWKSVDELYGRARRARDQDTRTRHSSSTKSVLLL